MQAIVAGLGNPGQRYQDTRHNAGFLVVDAFAAQLGATWKTAKQFDAEIAPVSIGSIQLLLAKPTTFMNGSGRALSSLAQFYKLPPTACVVVYDEYQLPPGGLKISVRGSAGGHNGVADIIRHLGSDFVRLRVGIGSDKPREMVLADFVLGKLPDADRTAINARMPDYLGALRMILEQGPQAAMNHFHQQHKATASSTNGSNPQTL